MNMHQEALKEVLVLLAPGFAETEVAHFTSSMRDNKVPTTLVGLTTQQVSGHYGLSVNPDNSLNQLPDDKEYPLALVLGGYKYLSSLMADPRVHRLLGKILNEDGYVAVDKTAEPFIPYTTAKSLLNGDNFVTPKDMNREEFTQYLINLVKSGPLPS